MRRLADSEEPKGLIPPVVEPVEVEVPVGLVGIDVRDVTVAIPIHDRAIEIYIRSSIPLPFEYS